MQNDMPGWQPIETAPKTGARVLLWTSTRNDEVQPYIDDVCEGEHVDMVQIGYWEDEVNAPMRQEPAGWRKDIIGQPLFWLPLPPPPVPHD